MLSVLEGTEFTDKNGELMRLDININPHWFPSDFYRYMSGKLNYLKRKKKIGYWKIIDNDAFLCKTIQIFDIEYDGNLV